MHKLIVDKFQLVTSCQAENFSEMVMAGEFNLNSSLISFRVQSEIGNFKLPIELVHIGHLSKPLIGCYLDLKSALKSFQLAD